MPFIDAKIYYDGSHYICIPYNPPKKRKKKKVTPDLSGFKQLSDEEVKNIFGEDAGDLFKAMDARSEQRKKFDEAYEESKNENKQERKEKLVEAVKDMFSSETTAELYVEANLDRIRKNYIKRKMRLIRKINLQTFNYFVTFTYSDELHTEDSFRKSLKKLLSNFSTRRKWKYIGVFERSPKKQRLHFHALLYAPDGTMPCELKEVKGYSVRLGKVQTTYQCDYFTKRFGIVDFEPINQNDIADVTKYLTKYIEKSGEKLIYSKGLPQYFISDIADEDVICPYDENESKYVLNDNFTCYDYGEEIGIVSAEVIERLRKCN